MRLYFSKDDRYDLDPVSPQKLAHRNSKLNKIDGKPYISHTWRDKRRLMEQGYIIQPSDCPPIRNLTKYGYQIFASGTSVIETHKESQARSTLDMSATNGFYTHSGEKCEITDSQFLSSWLANSEYIKIITGLVLFCPVGYGLYQGPIPYVDNKEYEVFSGIEYSNSMGTYIINEEKYFMVEVNIIIKPLTKKIEIERNTPLAVIYPVLRPSEIELESIDIKIT